MRDSDLKVLGSAATGKPLPGVRLNVELQSTREHMT